jgi:branched-chain amino acid transport system substrate-binding protein
MHGSGSVLCRMRLLAVALVAAGMFGASVPANAQSSSNEPADEIPIGVAGPMTGPRAEFGVEMQKGAEQAAADINAAGGMNGAKIVLTVRNDVGDRKRGLAVAKSLAADGVKFVVGHYNSDVTIPVSEFYAEHDTLMISPSSTNPLLTERGLWNTFRTTSRDDGQGIVAAQYIAANFPDAKIALIHDNTPYGLGLTNATKKAMNAAGLNEAMYKGVKQGQREFSPLIKKIKKAGITVVYFGGLYTEAGPLMRQMADQGLRVTFIGADGLVSSKLETIAGDALDGTLMTFAPDPRRNAAASDIVERFRAKGFEPEAYTIPAYVALQVVAAAANKAGSSDPRTVAAMIRSGGPWQTVVGEIRYNEKGDMVRPDYIIYEWRKDQDGKYRYFEKGM